MSGARALLLTLAFLAAAAFVGAPPAQVGHEARSVTISAVAQPGAFRESLPPDHQYHAVVFKGGGAAARSLFVTDTSDRELAQALRALGAQDGGGVPMAAWNLRWIPLVRAPDARVSGSRIRVTVAWEGREPVELAALLEDSGGKGLELRFGGNEEHDAHWDSGCILCLFSCPGGVVSNAAYTIRDHQRAKTQFLPSRLMPAEGTPVEITFTLVDSG